MSGASNSSAPKAILWNIFARELADILKTHKMRLGQLDDPPVVIYREKVRRLQHSLLAPTHFPTLNPDELERMYAIIGFTEPEKDRIRAAVAATAVERILMDRVDVDVAYMAAEDVFRILIASMRARPGTALARIKASPAIDDETGESDETSSDFEEGLDRFDAATLTLHLSLQAKSARLQRMYAQDAADGFTAALALLRKAQTSQADDDARSHWEQEALAGHKIAQSLLQSQPERQPGGEGSAQ